MFEVKTTEEIADKYDTFANEREKGSDWTDKDEKIVSKKWVAVDDVKKGLNNLYECLSAISYKDDELDGEMCVELCDVDKFIEAMEKLM